MRKIKFSVIFSLLVILILTNFLYLTYLSYKKSKVENNSNKIFMFDLKELKNISSPSNCLIVIDDYVYNLTPIIDNNSPLINHCGEHFKKEELFYYLSNNSYYNIILYSLGNFKIGILKNLS